LDFPLPVTYSLLISSLLPVLSRHIGHLVGVRLFLFLSSSSPVIYSGKVPKVFPIPPSGYEVAAKTVAGNFAHLSVKQSLMMP